MFQNQVFIKTFKIWHIFSFQVHLHSQVPKSLVVHCLKKMNFRKLKGATLVINQLVGNQ